MYNVHTYVINEILKERKHRRRMEREAKAKAVASVGGLGSQNLLNFLPRYLFCLGLFGRIG